MVSADEKRRLLALLKERGQAKAGEPKSFAHAHARDSGGMEPVGALESCWQPWYDPNGPGPVHIQEAGDSWLLAVEWHLQEEPFEHWPQEIWDDSLLLVGRLINEFAA